MSVNTIDASLCARMFLAGSRNLEAKKEWINELNVFPVPDGDTGTNMTMTIMSAAKEVSSLENMNMETFAKAVSSGSLRGARGNSGVILSQLLRGFTKVIKKEEVIDTTILAASFQKAVETAYKAVMKPKEGTILTVAKGASDKAVELLADNPDIEMSELIDQVVATAEIVLNKTPEMLPVLKEAGVVDSGGQGLLQILKGAQDAFYGREIEYTDEVPEEAAVEEIKYAYCTEMVINLENAGTVATTKEEFTAYLEGIGEDIFVVSDGNAVKVHVHTNNPGEVLTKALFFGELTNVTVENLRVENDHKDEHKISFTAPAKEEPVKAEPKELKEYGFISVSIGEGIGEIFKDLGVDYLIEGGQTMNPSTEDMLNAIDKVDAKNIFILPNNKNIVMAANQARDLTEDKNIIVIPTKTIPQGITAVINFVPEKSVEENRDDMTEEIARVKTGQLTYAVRDTHIDDKTICAGDIMGVGDHSILAVGKEIDPVAIETVKEMVDDESELISIYYGEDMKEEEAEALRDKIAEEFSDLDVELNPGGQPIYYYIISVE